MRKYKAALLGYYGFNNLGDDLLLQASINLLVDSGISRKKIIAFSNNPDETSKNFHIESINRWHYREIWQTLKNCESLILGGGGLFQDSTSIKSCIWYWAIMRLANLAGTKIFALGQSIGPLESRFGRFFTGNALRLCEFVHVRDNNSQKIAENFNCRNVIKGSDIALSLVREITGKITRDNACYIESISESEGLPQNSQEKRGRMLINLRPCKNLDSFVKVIQPYINNYPGEKVGVALSPEDENALKYLKLDKIVRVKNFHEACEIWQNSKIALGMRLHFGVLSRIFATPLALMPYDVKVSEFANESGVPCIIDKWENPVKPHEINLLYYDKICTWINTELMK